MSRPGSLRTYLGTAPGVGKTYRMLADGSRRAETGDEVVVGWVERHGRPRTAARAGDLEVIMPRRVVYRGHSFADLDVKAVIESGADLGLIDELAHTLPDGRRRRWEDVAEILAAGLDVWTTTNVANLQTVRDYAARITGVGAVESVPDEFVRSGDVVLIDMPADALRRRISSGSVYSSDQVGGALADYFRVDNLEALSELGRAWMAGELEEAGDQLLIRRGLARPQSRPLIMAGITGSRGAERVIRRAAWLARQDDGDLLVVNIEESDGWPRNRARRRSSASAS